MKRMLSLILNRIGWRLVKATTPNTDLHLIVLKHSCGSEEVQPVGKMFGWKKPAFQCFKCNAIVSDGGITLRSVNAGEIHNQRSFAHALF